VRHRLGQRYRPGWIGVPSVYCRGWNPFCVNLSPVSPKPGCRPACQYRVGRSRVPSVYGWNRGHRYRRQYRTGPGWPEPGCRLRNLSWPRLLADPPIRFRCGNDRRWLRRKNAAESHDAGNAHAPGRWARRRCIPLIHRRRGWSRRITFLLVGQYPRHSYLSPGSHNPPTDTISGNGVFSGRPASMLSICRSNGTHAAHRGPQTGP